MKTASGCAVCGLLLGLALILAETEAGPTVVEIDATPRKIDGSINPITNSVDDEDTKVKQNANKNQDKNPASKSPSKNKPAGQIHNSSWTPKPSNPEKKHEIKTPVPMTNLELNVTHETVEDDDEDEEEHIANLDQHNVETQDKNDKDEDDTTSKPASNSKEPAVQWKDNFTRVTKEVFAGLNSLRQQSPLLDLIYKLVTSIFQFSFIGRFWSDEPVKGGEWWEVLF